jgi:hypothetical protein
MGSGCIDPRFFDLGTSWRPLYLRGKRPRYPFDRRLGGPHNRSRRCGEEKILDPTGTRPPTSHLFIVQPVANRYTECAIPEGKERRKT